MHITFQSLCLLFSLPVPTFTFFNVLSSVLTVKNWDQLGKYLQVPSHKRKSKDIMVNYFVTSVPNASWERLAVALYYYGEENALTVVKSYFQRNPGTFVQLKTQNLSVTAESNSLNASWHLAPTIA